MKKLQPPPAAPLGQARRCGNHSKHGLDRPSAYSEAGAAELHPADGSSWANHAVQVLRGNGVPAERSHIAHAIDALAARGRFTTLQAHALKSYEGPLKGEAGKAVA